MWTITREEKRKNGMWKMKTNSSEKAKKKVCRSVCYPSAHIVSSSFLVLLMVPLHSFVVSFFRELEFPLMVDTRYMNQFSNAEDYFYQVEKYPVDLSSYSYVCFLKLQPCKLYNNKYMIASTQIANTIETDKK